MYGGDSVHIPKRAYVLLVLAAFLFAFSSLREAIYRFINIPWEIGFVVEILFQISIPISVSLLAASILIILKAIFVHQQLEKSNTNSVEQLRDRLFDGEKATEKNRDILELMLANMSEIKQYYSISKRHAQFSFILALSFCIFGFILLAYAVSIDKENTQPIMLSLIGGTVSEPFAGTALLVHKSSLSQLNHYYKSLHENERFLSTLNLVEKLSDSKKDDAILKIIDSSLSDISNLIATSMQ